MRTLPAAALTAPLPHQTTLEAACWRQATAGRKGQIRTQERVWETEQEHAGGHADGAAVVGAAGGRRAAVPARRKASARHGVAKGQQRQQRGQQR
jgi:hypothetical protein